MTSQPAPKTFTPAERITELNGIDFSISTLLTSAATATGILSNSSAHAPDTPASNLEQAEQQLTTSIETFFTTLASIEVRLRRNIYALEEAGLIEPGDEKDVRRARQGGELAKTIGGPLDPSWLNARMDNGVEAGLRKELLQEAKDFLTKTKADEGDAAG